VSESLGTYLLLGMILSAIVSIGAVIAVAILVVKLPADYFSTPRPGFWDDRHPVLRGTGRFLKNAVGAVVVVVGIVMSLPGIPGPGIVTVLIGVVLLDLPQKRRLEQWLIRRSFVRRTFNQWRWRFRRPPFE
jgi:hypothetical protein